MNARQRNCSNCVHYDYATSHCEFDVDDVRVLFPDEEDCAHWEGVA